MYGVNFVPVTKPFINPQPLADKTLRFLSLFGPLSVLLFKILVSLSPAKVKSLLCSSSVRLTGKIKISHSLGSFLYLTNSQDALNQRARENLRGWEEQTRKLFLNVITFSNYFVDVGAYSGVYSLLALSGNDRCHVISFEPSTSNRQLLVENIKANGYERRCSVRPQALSDSVRNSVLRAQSKWGMDSDTYDLDGDGESLEEVNVTTLDETLLKSQVDVLKIDVEGHELRVLQGGLLLLTEQRPLIIVECLTKQHREDIQNFLQKLNYEKGLQLDARNWFFYHHHKGYANSLYEQVLSQFSSRKKDF